MRARPVGLPAVAAVPSALRSAFACAVFLAVFASGTQARVLSGGPVAPTPADRHTAQAIPLSTSAPLPAYPRPEMVRDRWLNLNGRWQFLGRSAPLSGAPLGRSFPRRILVPFPAESRSSGIGRHYNYMWYRRFFVLPDSWRPPSCTQGCPHVLAQFGAVDYQSTVWVNGQKLATHQGGYAAFTVDITSALRPSGQQEIVVGARNLVERNPFDQVVGKQRIAPHSAIDYRPSSGIWQTVWLEPVAPAHITHLQLTPQIASSSLQLEASTSQGRGESITAIAVAGGQRVASVEGPANASLSMRIPSARLWTPSDPYLYGLTVTLRSGGRVLDRVRSYFGMRSIAIGDYAGQPHILLNGQFVFELGVLDQGMWPGGLYTAPSDAATQNDLEAAKALGFNTIRVHMAVEPDRFYYWADKLGLLVWQDMPALARPPTSSAEEQEYDAEAASMILQLQTHPSIVVWIMFNEGWGEFNPAQTVALARLLDPNRIVIADSGQNCCRSLPDIGAGDIYDMHSYSQPIRFPPLEARAVVIGEFGGVGVIVADHARSGRGWAWSMQSDVAHLAAIYAAAMSDIEQFEIHCGLSGAIYTQLYDVENEVDGFETYDRSVLKVDAATTRAINQAILLASSQLQPDTCGLVRPAYLNTLT